MLGTAGDLLRALWTRAPRDVAIALVLSAAASASQGAAALLLVPLMRLAGVATAAGVGRIGRAADTVFTAFGARPTLGAVLGAYVLAVAAQAALGAGARVATARLDHRFVQALRVRLYGAVTRAAWPFVVRSRGSEITHALTAELDRVGIAVSQVMLLTNQLLVAGVYIALAAFVSPAMTLVAAACGGLLLLGARAPARAARHEGERLSVVGAELHAAAQEHVAGLKEARSFGADARNRARFDALGAGLARSAERVVGRVAGAAGAFDVGAAMTLALLVYVALAVLHLATPAVLLLLVLFGRVVPSFSGLQQGWQQFAYALPAYEQVTAMIARFEAAAEPAVLAPVPAPSLHRALRLDAIEFAYPGRADAVLRGASLEVAAGRITVLVGASGAGKSTVVDIVLGMLVPSAGTVTVDGAALTPAMLSAWRDRVAYVAQDVFLLHDTLRANLLWARPDAQDDALRAALHAADAAQFVAQLPQGLDTVVGDRGATLSGGERQRIALARALLRVPDLLVLDEATSALDPASEARILEVIVALRERTTVLMVTHRATPLVVADAVYVLDGGRTVAAASGAHRPSQGSTFG